MIDYDIIYDITKVFWISTRLAHFYADNLYLYYLRMKVKF